VLHYVGLDCGLLEFFKYSTHEQSSKRKLFTFPAFLGDLFVEKEGGLCTYNPTDEDVGGLEVFLYLADQNF
jgi:hypothetical protein